VVVTCSCGSLFCSDACMRGAVAAGHDALCSPQARTLDQWCAEMGLNHPRAAAAAVARSLSSSSVDFGAFWADVNRLASVAMPPRDGDLPRSWQAGYRLVREALSANMRGEGAGAFFEHAFNLRAYGRLMGTLGLNAFSVPCPLDGPAAPAQASSSSSGGRGGGGGGGGSQLLAARAVDPNSSVPGAAAGGGGEAGGCCSTDAHPQPASLSSSCGSDPSSCSTPGGGGGGGEDFLRASWEAPGATALYAVASFLNHACEPTLDVSFGPGGRLTLRARRDLRRSVASAAGVVVGDELTITYLDSSLPLKERRARLRAAYGFDCACDMCARQEREEREERRKALAASAVVGASA
jgi:hypothetical protein